MVDVHPIEDVESNTNQRSSNFLYFRVSLAVAKGKEQHLIVDDVSEIVKSGESLAVMGPSGITTHLHTNVPKLVYVLRIGAGKTSLLRILTMEAFGAVSSGVVEVSGKPMTPQLFQRKCSIVNQEDFHWTFLTCKETISYAAELLMPHVSSEERKQTVATMIQRLGLEVCQDTIVGNVFIHGLSGGQKRRLSLAVVLLKKLEVLFLDEPTSGLDAASAVEVMKFVVEITKREKLISVFTIHQPSSQMFHSFDRLLLLTRGKTVYSGYVSDVASYFEGAGSPIPLHTNPAEYLLEVANTDFGKDKVEKLLDYWNGTGKPAHTQRVDYILSSRRRTLSQYFNQDEKLLKKIAKAWRHTTISLRRHLLLSLRDPMIYTGRMGAYLVSTLIFAVLYIHARVRDQEHALDRMWFANWCIAVPSNVIVVAVFVFNSEIEAIRREMKNGMTDVVAYLFANTLIQIPMVFLFVLFILPIAAYAIIDFQVTQIGQMWLIYAVTLYSFECVAQFMSVAFNHPLMGMLNYLGYWIISFLFSGTFLAIPSIIWPFRAFSFMTPLRFAFQLVPYFEFHGSTFRGAELCTYGEDKFCYPGGFYCPDTSICLGRTGEQILESFHTSFYVVSNQNMFGEYIANILAIALVAKVLFFILIIRKATQVSVFIRDKSRNSFPAQNVAIVSRRGAANHVQYFREIDE